MCPVQRQRFYLSFDQQHVSANMSIIRLLWRIKFCVWTGYIVFLIVRNTTGMNCLKMVRTFYLCVLYDYYGTQTIVLYTALSNSLCIRIPTLSVWGGNRICLLIWINFTVQSGGPLAAEARVRCWVIPCRFLWWTNWHWDRFLSQYFSFPCQYHSTNAAYSFIHLPPTLYNVSLPVLQFPLSVSFHQCSIPFLFTYKLLGSDKRAKTQNFQTNRYSFRNQCPFGRTLFAFSLYNVVALPEGRFAQDTVAQHCSV
jgi:hypothetical protein